MSKLIFLLMSLASLSSHALYGDLIDEEGPAHACRLVINDGQGSCSGTIIDSRIFKTAAHCLSSEKIESYRVVCPRGDSYKISKVEIHPNYLKVKDKRKFDVGVAYLKSDYNHELPKLILDRTVFIRALKSYKCAVWSYGPNVKNLQSLSDLHGVYLPSYKLKSPWLVVYEPLVFIVRGGDSGGGLYCKIGGSWIDVASVYGHDFSKSFFVRNDKVRSFLAERIDVENRALKSSDLKTENAVVITEKLRKQNIEIDGVYKVKPFSTLQKAGSEFGIGDQQKVEFKVSHVSKDGMTAVGVLRVLDISPLRYLCVDGVLCRGVYEEMSIVTDRLLDWPL